MTFTARLKAAWAFAAPYVTALYQHALTLLGWSWAATKVSLQPFWVPAVTLARNPLTAIVVAVLLIGAYLGGDRVRAVRDAVTVSKMIRAHKAELAEKDTTMRTNAALFIKEKADLVAERDALKAKVALLEDHKPKAEPVAAKASAKPKVAAPQTKPWSFF